MEKPGRLQSMGLLRVGYDWATSLSLFTFCFHALEKEMATHSSVFAWRIPGRGEPGGLLSMGSHRVGHDWSDLAAASGEITGKQDLHTILKEGIGISAHTHTHTHTWVHMQTYTWTHSILEQKAQGSHESRGLRHENSLKNTNYFPIWINTPLSSDVEPFSSSCSYTSHN